MDVLFSDFDNTILRDQTEFHLDLYNDYDHQGQNHI